MKFVINLELLHLAIELAAAQAAQLEVERQFTEQYPDRRLRFNGDVTVDFSRIEQLNIDMKDWEVGYR